MKKKVIKCLYINQVLFGNIYNQKNCATSENI